MELIWVYLQSLNDITYLKIFSILMRIMFINQQQIIFEC